MNTVGRLTKLAFDLRCYHCSYVSGRIVGQAGRPFKEWELQPTSNCWSLRHPGPGLRCCRCGVPVYLDDMETTIERPAEVINWKERRWKRGA